MKRIVTSLVSLMLAGCATVPTLQKPIEKTQVFKVPYDKVWDATVAALAGSGNILSVVQKESGVIVFEQDYPGNAVNQYVLEAGNDLFGTWTRLSAKLNIVAKAISPEETKITVNTKLIGYGKTYNFWTGITTPTEVLMNSNGTLEEQYLKMIAAQFPSERGLDWLEGKGAESKSKASPQVSNTNKSQ